MCAPPTPLLKSAMKTEKAPKKAKPRGRLKFEEELEDVPQESGLAKSLATKSFSFALRLGQCRVLCACEALVALLRPSCPHDDAWMSWK